MKGQEKVSGHVVMKTRVRVGSEKENVLRNQRRQSRKLQFARSRLLMKEIQVYQRISYQALPPLDNCHQPHTLFSQLDIEHFGRVY